MNDSGNKSWRMREMLVGTPAAHRIMVRQEVARRAGS
jgi:hypothetical protein